MLALLLPLAATLALPPASRATPPTPASACPEVEHPAPYARYTALVSAEQSLQSALAGARPACRAELETALGELALLTGRPSEALAPLTRAVLGDTPQRGRALAALGRALALDGKPFEALRSLALAERVAHASSAPDDDQRQALDAATLLARLHVRRGGTAWGAYRFEPLRRLEKSLESPRALAVSGSAWVALGKKALLADPDLPRAALPHLPESAKLVAIATSPRGDVAVLAADGTLLRGGSESETRSVRLLLGPARGVTGDGLAIGARDEAYVLAGSVVHMFSAEGKLDRTLPLRNVAAIATDGAGRLHALLDGNRGFVVLAPDGTPMVTVAATGESHRWSDAVAIASDALGGTYVLGGSPAMVWMFDAAGAFAGRLEAPPSDPRVLGSARAIAAGPAGEIFVLSGGNDSVGVFR